MDEELWGLCEDDVLWLFCVSEVCSVMVREKGAVYI